MLFDYKAQQNKKRKELLKQKELVLVIQQEKNKKEHTITVINHIGVRVSSKGKKSLNGDEQLIMIRREEGPYLQKRHQIKQLKIDKNRKVRNFCCKELQKPYISIDLSHQDIYIYIFFINKMYRRLSM